MLAPSPIVKTPLRIGRTEFADYSAVITYTTTDELVTLPDGVFDLSCFAFVDYRITVANADVTVPIYLTDSLDVPDMYQENYAEIAGNDYADAWFQVWTRYVVFSAQSAIPGSPSSITIECRFLLR